MQIGNQGLIRKAILDEAGTSRQHVVAEGDRAGAAEVRRIDADRVALWIDGRLVEIRLEFRGGAGGASGVSSGAATAGATAGVLETNRFGSKVSENRWVVDRKSVLEYYQELLDEPERMMALFDSMKPLYDERRRVTGYVLGVEGEADFFRTVGLGEGDIVRRVNSVPVTSKRWADHFIKEFVEDRMNVVVLDVEHDGKPGKLIYQVRGSQAGGG
jgi:type II secretory pathway component PulC